MKLLSSAVGPSRAKELYLKALLPTAAEDEPTSVPLVSKTTTNEAEVDIENLAKLDISSGGILHMTEEMKELGYDSTSPNKDSAML